MAAKQNPGDRYVQLASLEAIQTGANTLNFARLDIATGALLGEKKYGMLIHRILYGVAAGFVAAFNGAGDYLMWALTITNNITALGSAVPEVVDYLVMSREDIGAAASGLLMKQPFEKDFTSLPGSGLLVAADRLFLAVFSSGLTGAQTISARVQYTMIELDTQSYWDLVESRRIIST